MQLKNCGKAIAAGAMAAACAYSYLPSQIGKWKYRADDGERQKIVYLTFDDGPGPYTGQLLDLLQSYEIRAGFFVVAESAEKHPELIARMKEEGHLVGLHSLDHSSAMTQTPRRTRLDMEKSMEILRKLGAEPVYYRPPWGHVNWETLRQEKKQGLTQVLWHVMAQDWREDISPEEIQYRLLKRTGWGDIVCLHDGRGKNRAPERMLEALAATIPVWLEEGWQFKRVDACPRFLKERRR